MIPNDPIENMDPKERTLKILKGIDDMLTVFATQETVVNITQSNRHVSSGTVDIYLTEKITNALRWITSNLEINKIIDLINKECSKAGDYYLENPEVIKSLLKEKCFNVRMYN